MDQLLEAIARDPAKNLAIILIFGGGVLIALMGIFAGIVTSTTTRREFERSRREIAAYIAEGSISPEQGERLLAQKPNAEA